METTTRPGTLLRHRMLDDMRMRKFSEHTQDGYIRAVRKLAAFLSRSPDTATTEELRRFQLHLVDAGTGPVTINATITGLKFFFDITLGRPEVMAKMQHVRVPRKLPVILSPEEVGRLIAAALNADAEAAIQLNLQTRNTGITEMIRGRSLALLVAFNSIPHLEQPDRAHAVTHS